MLRHVTYYIKHIDLGGGEIITTPKSVYNLSATTRALLFKVQVVCAAITYSIGFLT